LVSSDQKERGPGVENERCQVFRVRADLFYF